MKKRIFIALNISKALQENIAEWESNFKSEISARWVDTSDLHITIVPPWYEEDISATSNIMDIIGRQFSPLNIRLDTITFGPDKRRPRLVWATGSMIQQMLSLRKNLLKKLGMPLYRKPFLLHLTLARIKRPQIAVQQRVKFAHKVNWQEDIDSLVLIESKLTKTGAVHTILHKANLKYSIEK